MVDATDFIDEIFNYESLDNDFIESTKLLHNRLNISMISNNSAAIYDLESIRKK